MTTRLTDTERTLLSAYRDGEVSGSEKARAEQLLDASPEAREYLGDLRSLQEISGVAFPVAPTVGAGAGFGSKLTSSAIQSAARTSAGTGFSAGWGLAGLAAAAITTIAVLTATLGGDDPADTPRPMSAAGRPEVPVKLAGLDVDSTSLLVPQITNAELIDFAVTGQLPIDSARKCYLTVAPQKGEIAIKVHGRTPRLSADLMRLDLAGVPGIDSLERAIRTSLLQSDNNGIAVSTDLPSLRLRVLAELQEVAGELPSDVRRSMSGTRMELERECQQLKGELRQSKLDERRERGAGQARFLVIAGTDLPKGVNGGGTGLSVTFTSNDQRVQTMEVSHSDIGALAAMCAPRPAQAVRTPGSRSRVTMAASSPRTVSTRRPIRIPQVSAQANTSTVGTDTAAITYDEIRLMQRRNQTLDGFFIQTENWISRAERILERADSIREAIRLYRIQDGARLVPDSAGGRRFIDEIYESTDDPEE
jgi:hypothetical protein